MKRIITAAASITMLAVLAGCSVNSTGKYKTEFDYKLNDGRTIHCVQFGAGNEASVSCDWENAK